LYSVCKLRKYLNEQKPDVLVSTLSRVNIAAILAKKFAGVNTKLILREANTFSVYLDSNKSLWDKIIDYIIKMLYRRGDKIVAVSEGVASDLRKTLPNLNNKITVIYNPVIDEEIFERSTEPVENDWLKNDKIPVVIGAGRISEQKDFSTLIKAFNIVLQQKEVRLLILGKYSENDSEYLKLVKLINELGIIDRVKFEGFVSNPFAYLSRASVFVLSSKWEGLPGVLIQALACGCPVVSTDCPSGPNEVISDQSIGYLSPVGDYNHLAENISKTLDSKIDKAALIERSKKFSVDKCADNYLKMIAEL
jgi:glycosyltransferase involved in cell wall biosynthesis